MLEPDLIHDAPSFFYRISRIMKPLHRLRLDASMSLPSQAKPTMLYVDVRGDAGGLPLQIRVQYMFSDSLLYVQHMSRSGPPIYIGNHRAAWDDLGSFLESANKLCEESSRRLQETEACFSTFFGEKIDLRLVEPINQRGVPGLTSGMAVTSAAHLRSSLTHDGSPEMAPYRAWRYATEDDRRHDTENDRRQNILNALSAR